MSLANCTIGRGLIIDVSLPTMVVAWNKQTLWSNWQGLELEFDNIQIENNRQILIMS